MPLVFSASELVLRQCAKFNAAPSSFITRFMVVPQTLAADLFDNAKGAMVPGYYTT